MGRAPHEPNVLGNFVCSQLSPPEVVGRGIVLLRFSAKFEGT